MKIFIIIIVIILKVMYILMDTKPSRCEIKRENYSPSKNNLFTIIGLSVKIQVNGSNN